jgi:hypothetical protein
MSTATDTESTNTNNQDAASKRIRIDPTAIARRPSANNKSNRSKKSIGTQSLPTADANNHMDNYLESRNPQTKSLLSRIAKPHLKHLLTAHHTSDKIKSFDECITLAIQEDTSNNPDKQPRWPKPVNFKFKLVCPKATSAEADFIELQKETETFLRTVKLELTKRMRAATAITLRNEQQQINASLARCMLHITVCYLKANNTADATTNTEAEIITDAHCIINSILEKSADSLL